MPQWFSGRCHSSNYVRRKLVRAWLAQRLACGPYNRLTCFACDLAHPICKHGRLGRLARHEAFSYIVPSSLLSKGSAAKATAKKSRNRSVRPKPKRLAAHDRKDSRAATSHRARKHRPGPRPKTHAGQLNSTCQLKQRIDRQIHRASVSKRLPALLRSPDASTTISACPKALPVAFLSCNTFNQIMAPLQTQLCTKQRLCSPSWWAGESQATLGTQNKTHGKLELTKMYRGRDLGESMHCQARPRSAPAH